MKLCRWFSAHVLCQFTLLAVAFWCASTVVCAFAQESAAAGESLPDNPSSAQHYVSPSDNKSAEHTLTFGKRVQVYRHDLLNYETIVGPAFGAGIGQWEDEPPGWHQGVEGYARRFGSGVARHEIAETIRFGFAAADGEDPRYFLSQDRSLWGKTKHAVVSTFVSPTASGGRLPAFSRFAGTYGAAFISNAWYPDNRATAAYAARRGSTALAAGIGFHVLREFVPFFRHKPE